MSSKMTVTPGNPQLGNNVPTVAAQDPKAFFASLREACELRVKGDTPSRYHLGCDFGRDPDGTLFQSARQHVERVIQSRTQS